ncbi:MAG: glycosyltransferase [Gemmatimonadaceae bacterium]
MSSPPVFVDPSGRRWRRVRGTALVAGVATTLLAALLVVTVLLPPILPAVAGTRADRELGAAPRWAGTRARREHLAARRRLFAALDQERPPPSARSAHLPLRSGAGLRADDRGSRSAVSTARDPVVAGFYVNWDDNSFASLRAHATNLDWVVCEWGFLGARGDEVALTVDRRVPFLLNRLPIAERPSMLLMVTNFDRVGQRFDAARLHALLASPAAMQRVSAALADAVRRYGLGGVVIDFEEIPADARPAFVRFFSVLRAALDAQVVLVLADSTTRAGTAPTAPPGRPLLVQAVGAGTSATDLRAYASVTDYTVLMLYDEHEGVGDAGPVASQEWYERQAAAALLAVDPAKLILAVGAYGYDWNDAEPDAAGEEVTFQDAMTSARRTGRPVKFDRASGNPYLTWTDSDSTDHAVWFLDGVTAYNQIAAGRRLGVAGHAVWRLGGEDPSLWQVLGRTGLDGPAEALAEIPAGYDVEFEGAGELLRVAARPTAGRRAITVDAATGRVLDESVHTVPTPYVVTRVGGDSLPTRAGGRKIALTFDDGPDPVWTPAILDTLRARHAPATFFVIGAHALSHPGLVRRLWSDGHEVGNHTYTHPNLALTSPLVTRLELDATERLLEALLDRRSAFFRPPYFGDAEPTTADELVPVGIAGDLGYLTAGLHIDSEDWQQPTPRAIVDTVLGQRDRGHVVLLHDGGGNRAATVAAIGPLIDSLRARGDSLVLLSALVNLTRDQAMPPLPASGNAARLADLAAFGVLGAVEWAVHWLFLVAVALGLGRLVIVTGLALVQRYRPRAADKLGHNEGGAPTALPRVSVIIPAYNEEKVVVKTVTSVLEQDYAGELEIVVVDDGSPDATYQVANDAFGNHPRITVLTKPNGGKASALNEGVRWARGDIVIGLDADTVFLPDTVTRLVAPMTDPRVGAVAGNAKVGNRVNLVTRWQAVEYVTSQNLDRRAFALLDCITVVPGAVGAWRRDLVRQAGGFSHDTLAEDQDLTLAIRRLGYRVAYADAAVAYTEAPDTLRGLAKQRFRWSFGTLQCMWKHRDALLRPRYGTLGMVAMPNVWIFQLGFAAVSPLADLLFAWSLASVWLTWREHGATYAVTNLEQVLTFYAVFLLVDWGAGVIAFFMEPGEDRRLTWLILLQRFAYRQVMYWVVVRAFAAALRGRILGWGSLERKATVQVPA